jgi:Fur family ferric uptake transcriptional regulator
MPSDTELRDLLRTHDLRATQSRLAVLHILHGQASPSSHPEVTQALASNGWDRSTLYRNLTDMAAAGILCRVDLGDRVWRYELANSSTHHSETDHPHFLCTECGDVSCLEKVDVTIGGSVPSAVSLGSVAIQLRGLCDTCTDA